MDLIKVGRFISELRKEKRLTQEQLGEKIGVTNKTISRWETGTYMPPADALLIMSELFSVNINEILSGKRLQPEEYKEAAEENLKQTIRISSFTLKDKIDFYKKKWLKEHIALMIFGGLLVIGILVAGLVVKNSLLGYISIVLLLIFHAIRNNRMMAYVEQNAYDGTGNINV
ncbi:helix-turn-helix domain-containing protein [Anaerosporobacter sp.]|uniref:helix-turn-helix domain-containing protein n=1 Tax=Anaerosporobacter sp. TaxID=1872529 RepID=UPI00286F7AC0|nr:helix-turn-helix transcriptional regulator [Anaerosporobacter sp.]